MILLKTLLQEIIDGDGYLTKQKFASIIQSELQKEFTFPSKAEIEVLILRDMKKGEFGYIPRSKRDKYGHAMITARAKIYNSDLGVVYAMNYKNKTYHINICNTFKKVPDKELTNKFTMADDETLKRIPSKSLEPRDFNTKNELIIWMCNVKTVDNKILIPKKPGYAIYFDKYDTLKDLIADVKRVIDIDAGNDFNDINPTQPTPITPEFQKI
jgi:hypothetical protein